MELLPGVLGREEGALVAFQLEQPVQQGQAFVGGEVAKDYFRKPGRQVRSFCHQLVGALGVTRQDDDYLLGVSSHKGDQLVNGLRCVAALCEAVDVVDDEDLPDPPI